MKSTALKIQAYGWFLVFAHFWFGCSVLMWMKGLPQALWRACTTYLPINQELPLLLITVLISISFVLGASFALVYLGQYLRHLGRLSSTKLTPYWLKKKLVLWLSQDETVPAYTIGFFKKKIIIAAGLRSKLTPKQLEAVWLHEHYHARHNHIWLSFLAKLSPYLLFFVPFIKDISGYLLLLLETSADEFVIRLQGTDRHLKQALVYALENDAMVGVHFGGKLLSDRIDRLSGSPVSPSKLIAAKAVVALSLILGSSLLLLQLPSESLAYSGGKECSLPVLELPLFSPLPRASFPFSTAP